MWKVIQDIWFAVRLSLDILFDYVMVIACVLMFLRQTSIGGDSYDEAFDQTVARVLQSNEVMAEVFMQPEYYGYGSPCLFETGWG